MNSKKPKCLLCRDNGRIDTGVPLTYTRCTCEVGTGRRIKANTLKDDKHILNVKIREECLKALRDYRAYRKIHPEAFQAWACSQRKGAALMARKILRLIKQAN
jgi:hypothetical protein